MKRRKPTEGYSACHCYPLAFTTVLFWCCSCCIHTCLPGTACLPLLPFPTGGGRLPATIPCRGLHTPAHTHTRCPTPPAHLPSSSAYMICHHLHTLPSLQVSFCIPWRISYTFLHAMPCFLILLMMFCLPTATFTLQFDSISSPFDLCV